LGFRGFSARKQGLDIIMHMNQGSIAQKNLTRTSGWKNKEARDLNEKTMT
jgi:hypothetical protein